MNGLQKTTIETKWKRYQKTLTNVDNGATLFPTKGDATEADVVVVDWFCIATRIWLKDSPDA